MKLLLLCLMALITSVFANPLVLPLNDGKGKIQTGLNIVTSVKGDKINIELNDGKLKYGVHNIIIKKGDVTLTRPRLTLQVPLEKIKEITDDKPYHVVNFFHDGFPYNISITSEDKENAQIIIKRSTF